MMWYVTLYVVAPAEVGALIGWFGSKLLFGGK